jgi:ABC-type polysaccharide/polyol phosphate transport system ATPase subunit
MLKTIRLLTLCLLLASPLAAQDTYFQQKADYRIAVKLDDSRQMLLSHIDIQ